MHPPKSPSRAKAWGRRQWVHLALSAVGLGMFVLCCVVVIGPQLKHKAHRHGVGAWIHKHQQRAQPHVGGIPPLHSAFYTVSEIGERLIARTPNGIEDLGDPDAHYGVLSELWKPADGRTAWIVSAFDDQEPAGLWAPTSKTHTISTQGFSVLFRLGYSDLSDNPTAPVSVRAAFWDAMAAEGQLAFPEAVPTLIAYGKWTGATVVWSGYAINIATIAGLGMWVWCTPIVVRDVIRAWQRKPHMCAACGYDLRGLATTVCPECGSEIFIAGAPTIDGPARPQ